MTRWIVFEPPTGETGASDADAGPGARSDRAVFVRDAFVKWAVLFPFLWLFRHGLILSGILVLAATLGFGLLSERPAFSLAATAVPLLLGVLVALEGPSLRAARLRRRGYRETAVLDASDEEEAAILYFANEPATIAPVASVATVLPRQMARADMRALRPQTLLDPAGGR